MHLRQLTVRVGVGALLVGALLGISSACGRSPAAGKGSPSANDNITPFAQLIPKDAGDLGSVLTKAPTFQRNILADGKVTFDEYQRSVFATVQCAKSHGITFVENPVLGPGKKYAYQMSLGTTDGERDTLKKAFDTCYQQYENLVDIGWTMENKPSQETVNHATVAFAACLQQAGVSLPEIPAESDFLAAQTSSPAEFSACSDAVSKKFDIQGFAP